MVVHFRQLLSFVHIPLTLAALQVKLSEVGLLQDLALVHVRLAHIGLIFTLHQELFTGMLFFVFVALGENNLTVIL